MKQTIEMDSTHTCGMQVIGRVAESIIDIGKKPLNAEAGNG